jgi:hypothetical protein
MALSLSIELQDGTVESLTVDVAGPVTIGRDPTCHVVLPSPDVSRRHLSIEPLPTGLFVVTDSSANGTMVGNQRVRQQGVQVPAGVPMRVGPYIVRPVLGPGQVAQAQAPGFPPQLLENLDLASLDRNKMDDKVMRPKVRDALKRIVAELAGEMPPGTDLERSSRDLRRGPRARPARAFLADELISEIMVVDPHTIYVERRGKLEQADARFTDDEAVRVVHRAHRHAARPAHRREHAARRRAPEGRLARQRGHQARWPSRARASRSVSSPRPR